MAVACAAMCSFNIHFFSFVIFHSNPIFFYSLRFIWDEVHSRWIFVNSNSTTVDVGLFIQIYIKCTCWTRVRVLCQLPCFGAARTHANFFPWYRSMFYKYIYIYEWMWPYLEPSQSPVSVFSFIFSLLFFRAMREECEHTENEPHACCFCGLENSYLDVLASLLFMLDNTYGISIYKYFE